MNIKVKICKNRHCLFPPFIYNKPDKYNMTNS